MANLLSWLQDAAYNTFYGDVERKRQQAIRNAEQIRQTKAAFNAGNINRQQYVDRTRTLANGMPNQQRRQTPKPISLNQPQQNTFTRPQAPKLNLQPSFNQSSIDQGLNAGRSWEDISRDTGASLDSVRAYSQKTRPNYGIKPVRTDQKFRLAPQRTNEPPASLYKDAQTFTPSQQSQLGDNAAIARREDADRVKNTPVFRQNLNQINQMLDQGRSFEDISDSSGVGVGEVDTYVKQYRPGYGIKQKSPLETVADAIGSFGKGAVDAATIVPRMVTTTVADTFMPETRNALDGLNASWRRGEISGERLAQEANSLYKDNIDKEVVFDENGAHIEVVNPLEFAQRFTDAGVQQASVLPMASGVRAVSTPLRQAVTQLAKEGAVYGTADTANDVIQGRFTPEGALLNYAAGIGSGVVPYGIGRALTKGANSKVVNDLVNTYKNSSLADEAGNIDFGAIAQSVKRRINPAEVTALNDHIAMLRQNEQQLLSNGLSERNPAIIQNRRAQMDAIEARNNIRQGGFIGGDNDALIREYAASHINPESLVKENVDYWQRQGKETKGGQLIDTTGETDAYGSGKKRISEHNQFYSDHYKQNKKPPTKADYEREVVRQLEAGGGSMVDPDLARAYKLVKERQKEQLPQTQSNQQPSQTAYPQHPEGESVLRGSDVTTGREKPGPYQTSQEPQGSPSLSQTHPFTDNNAPTGTNKQAVQHVDEPLPERDVKTDVAIQKSLENANTDVKELVDTVSKMRNLSENEAREYIKKVADQSGIDITTGYPTKIRSDKDVITPLVDDSGKVKQTGDIDTTQPKLPAARGVDHAVVVKQSNFQKVYAYRDENGLARTFIQNRRPDGSWGKLDKSDVPIKSNYNLVKIRRLADDASINRELLNSQKDGITRGFIWTEAGRRGDVAELVSDRKKQKPLLFDSTKHYVEGGLVRNRESGDILGNYVQVGPGGVRLHVGKHMIDLGDIDFSKLKNVNKSTYSADRMVEAITKDEAIREALREMLVKPAQRGERLMRVEAHGLADGINDWEKQLRSVAPTGGRKAFDQDVAAYIERKLAPSKEMVDKLGKDKAILEMARGGAQDSIFREKYGDAALSKAKEYKEFLRATYDNLLNRLNQTRLEWGYDEIPRRKDYLTHIQEINGNPLTQVWNDLSTGIMGDAGDVARRGSLPSTIAGQTKDRTPISKFNQFAQRRYGNDVPNDAINPLREYSAIALHNIHMTESAALARGFETALRSVGEMKQNMPSPKGLSKPAKELWDKTESRLTNDLGRLTTWAQEQANMLSGKTAALDRAIIDNLGKFGEGGLRNLGRLSNLTSRTAILGNASSVLAQTLNTPSLLAKAGPVATAKGFGRSFTDLFNKNSRIWRESDAMVSRYTEANLRERNALRVVQDATGLPMRAVERAMVTFQWNTLYEKALSNKLTGHEAIDWATRESGKIVPWRGIGDTAHLYNNKVVNQTLLKFLREPIEQTRHWWKDLTPGQKFMALAYASAANAGTAALIGREYLPSPLTSAQQTIADFSHNDEDPDDTVVDNTLQAGQRLSSDVVSAVPLLSQAMNVFLDADTRKKIFGDDSELGRYSGDLAITSPITNLVAAKDKLFNGDIYGAVGDAAAATVTGGSQIRKTMEGTQALYRGYTTSDGGRVQAAVDNKDPWNVIRGILFGKNALGEQQDYFNNKQSVLGEDQTEKFKSLNSDDQKEYMREIQENRANNTGSSGTVIEDKGIKSLVDQNKQRSDNFRNSFSDDDWTIYQMSKADQKKLIDGGVITQEKLDGLKNYAEGKRKELGYEDTANETYKQKYDDAKAEWDRESSRWSSVEKSKKRKDLSYLGVRKDYSDDTVSLYGMSKGDVYDLVSTEKNGQKLLDDAVKYGDALVKAGLIDRNKFRDKYGNLLLNPRGARSGRGKSAKSKAPVGLTEATNAYQDLTIPKTSGPPSGKTSPVASAALRKLALKTYSPGDDRIPKAPVIKTRKGMA